MRFYNVCFRQQRTGYFTTHSVHYIYCIYGTSCFTVQLTALGVQRNASRYTEKATGLTKRGSILGRSNRTSKPELGPTSSPFQCVPGLFLSGEDSRSVSLAI